MTGYPPDDGAFPGRPGEQPFPGQPGGQSPYAPQDGQPYGGQQPQPGAYVAGYPGQQPGQGGQYGQHGPYGAQPPGPPGFAAPPPGSPPQQPPVPGMPGPSGPPRRAGGRALLVGVAAAVVVLLVAGGLVVWNVTGSRPYASLPTCRQLLNEVVDEIPGSERPRVEGEYLDSDEYFDEYSYGDEDDMEGFEGVLECNVQESSDTGDDEDHYGDSLMRVSVMLYDAEDERAMEDLRSDVEEEIETLEDDAWNEDAEELEVVDWLQLSAGDGGRAMIYEIDYGESRSTALSGFVTANARVSFSYTPEDRYDEQEELEFMSSFSGLLESQLNREAERG